MPEREQPDLARVFHALSDETRLKVVLLLSDGELCVCDLMAALEMAQSRISFHMGVLKSAGLVASRTVGRWNAYRLRDQRRLFSEIFGLVRKSRAVHVVEEKKRLKAYLKCKKRFFPGESPCCPDIPPGAANPCAKPGSISGAANNP
ncbi:MAG: winged helix-turn-helix transcriptional regulator [Nitrospirae bacterium]|nr:winged helix-turn-helix transcriptional regulator [Nitrospirota bacterium]